MKSGAFLEHRASLRRARVRLPVRDKLGWSTFAHGHLSSRRGTLANSVDDSSDSKQCSLAGAAEIVTRLLTSISDGTNSDRLDAFLAVVPDELLDSAIESVKDAGRERVSFDDLVPLMQGEQTLEEPALTLDSYTERMCLMTVPSSATLLSSLIVSPGRSIHRCAVQSGAEAAVLTFSMSLQETLQAQYRSSPRIGKVWVLRSINGEPDLGGSDLPSEPSPSLSPETVVQIQLAALQREDIATVYAFASPGNRASTGPLEKFGQLFASPLYMPLLKHESVESQQKIQVDSNKFIEIMSICSSNTGMPNKRGRFMYVWEVVKEKVEGREGVDGDKLCWVTQSVQLVSVSNAAGP